MAGISLKQLVRKEEGLAPGHRACAGCTAPSLIRQALLAAENDVVIGFATGCMEVVTTIYPYTAWKIPYIHSAFENVAATISGAEAAYRSLKRQGKIDKNISFIAMAGDGGTYDIGLQALSGVLERGHNMLYICYDNQAYMNTGIQRSGATPMYANTSTCPYGDAVPGKMQKRKPFTEIIAAHNIPYTAQAGVHNFMDLMRKVRRSLEVDGPAFINVLAPCHRGWRIKQEESFAMSRLATDTCFWPLYEVDDGEWKLNYKPREKKPIIEWIKPQGRFRHLLSEASKGLVEQIQAEVDRNWERLLARCEAQKAK